MRPVQPEAEGQALGLLAPHAGALLLAWDRVQPMTSGDYAYWSGRLSAALRLYVAGEASEAQMRLTLAEYDAWHERTEDELRERRANGYMLVDAAGDGRA